MKNISFAKIVFLSLVFVFSATISNASCNSQLVGNQYNRLINQGRIDQNLFNSAILFYTNQIRCRRGISLLTTEQDVFGAATVHAETSASTRTYSHTLSRGNIRTLRDRLRRQNTSFRAAGENIAKTFVYYLNGRGYIESGRCTFRYTANGRSIPVHTYKTLAREVVDSWENSRGHLQNILNRRYTRMGAGLGIVKNTPLCGELYATQVFAG